MYYNDRIREIHETQFNFLTNCYEEFGFSY